MPDPAADGGTGLSGDQVAVGIDAGQAGSALAVADGRGSWTVHMAKAGKWIAENRSQVTTNFKVAAGLLMAAGLLTKAAGADGTGEALELAASIMTLTTAGSDVASYGRSALKLFKVGGVTMVSVTDLGKAVGQLVGLGAGVAGAVLSSVDPTSNVAQAVVVGAAATAYYATGPTGLQAQEELINGQRLAYYFPGAHIIDGELHPLPSRATTGVLSPPGGSTQVSRTNTGFNPQVRRTQTTLTGGTNGSAALPAIAEPSQPAAPSPSR
ncbi:hypothetical protein [Streptomyces sp. NPDC047061]|uniref:hypothetical protein n=1 Tax=Streptomyces sp. NPDC047061 TaxID=3154605 RepID=UPI0033F24CD7